MSSTDPVRLRHMRDAAAQAIAFVQGRSRGDLDTDLMLSLALVRLIEILGEAAKHLSPELKDAHPEIPWRPITGTRDRLIHGYFNVDHDILWTILQDQLPPLVKTLDSILTEVAP